MKTTEASEEIWVSRELAPWTHVDLPEPPLPRGLQWIGVCGPGVVVLGMAIGRGEFLSGPATFVRHGLTLLWMTLLAAFFQTVFNTALMRYTVATGMHGAVLCVLRRARSAFADLINACG